MAAWLIKDPQGFLIIYALTLLTTVCTWFAPALVCVGFVALCRSEYHFDPAQLVGGIHSMHGFFVYLSNHPVVRLWSYFFFITIINWLYQAILESSSKQATFGKRIMGLRVVNTQAKTLSFGQATLRHFSKPLSLLLVFDLMRGIISFRRFKSISNSLKSVLLQPMHDKVSGCLVVERPVKRSLLLEPNQGLARQPESPRQAQQNQ
jgi:uncharacterized RDD family membrane protein YckC